MIPRLKQDTGFSPQNKKYEKHLHTHDLAQNFCGYHIFIISFYYNIFSETVEQNISPISGQCSHFLPPENTRKPNVFCYSQGCKVGTFVKNDLRVFYIQLFFFPSQYDQTHLKNDLYYRITDNLEQAAVSRRV